MLFNCLIINTKIDTCIEISKSLALFLHLATEFRGLLIAELPNPSPVRAVGEHIKLIKPQRHKVYRERLCLFMRKRDEKAEFMVLPFRHSFVSSSHYPETSSRVALALLGSVFLTKNDGNVSHKIGQSLYVMCSPYGSHFGKEVRTFRP